MTATATTVPTRPRLRRITGLTPSGHLHLGNLIGAMLPIAAGQHTSDTVVFLADLHALTLEHDPAQVRANTLEQATLLLAAGVDPEAALFYPQSQVPAHTELHYLLECVTGAGEAQRMIQYKEKSARQQHVRLSLLTYPVLMAADILLHQIREVPVGDDQRQHVELARDVAIRFNHRYGETFTVPVAVHPSAGARLMDLTDPTSKMSKSAGSGAGTLFLLDPPDVLRRKVMRAVTDSGDAVAYDPANRPGLANLLEILSACTGRSPAVLAGEFTSYGRLKAAVADAVLALVEPVQSRYAELSREPAYVRELLRTGAGRAREATAATVRAARTAIGLLD
ncbi:tryptophan--tRNA ligase [Plantactinospora siamensis]|uniref:Tryptophan--tRNA ligase n=1 Tax=Plantactinospora siamensis TaxID=555372 RepID=A0ABV6NUQ6_9ACTN